MCTQEQVRDILLEEFNKKDGLKEQITAGVKTELDAEIGKFSRRQISSILAFAIAALGAWFSLYYQVQGLEKHSNENVNVADFNAIKQTVDDHSAALKNVATKEDLDRIYNAITRLEDRLFER